MKNSIGYILLLFNIGVSLAQNVDSVLGEMSTKDKVGQILMVGVKGHSLSVPSKAHYLK